MKKGEIILEKKWYRPREVANLMGVSKSQVMNYIKDGFMPATRIPIGKDNKRSYYKIRKQEVKKWFK